MSKGTVGASGDLAPLTHMSAILLGEVEASFRGELISAEEARNVVGLSRLPRPPKRGLPCLMVLKHPRPSPCRVCFKQRLVLMRRQLLGQ